MCYPFWKTSNHWLKEGTEWLSEEEGEKNLPRLKRHKGTHGLEKKRRTRLLLAIHQHVIVYLISFWYICFFKKKKNWFFPPLVWNPGIVFADTLKTTDCRMKPPDNVRKTKKQEKGRQKPNGSSTDATNNSNLMFSMGKHILLVLILPTATTTCEESVQ